MYDELVKRLKESKKEQCYIGCFGNCRDCKIDAELEQAADAIEELMKAAKSMHTWIFLNTGDEQKAYDECGLTDAMNAELGYCGAYELRKEPPKGE